MSEIQELEAKLIQSQKKLNELQYEVNIIHKELQKLKEESSGQLSGMQPAQSGQPLQQGSV